ncbi:MAG: type II secretion system minor pseudopilin GspI [Thermodesulfobacteriota bacterium]|nr:type II secretion system minor pseudopilin GspI [Thermodesulfobacteriota bacterium]
MKTDTKSGFTLIEIMVAMAIFALAFTGLFRLFSQTITAETATRFYTVAPIIAQGKMAEAVAGMHGRNGRRNGNAEGYAGYAWEIAIRNTDSPTLESAAQDVKRIDVVVQLNDGERTYRLRRYAFLE